ncbi:MAG: MarR family transcriptional regulator [Oscillibacter sp.]|jgi:DNA-binding MarR family transcriptional regulator|nr:MarR family transcriptional regulator [Oscillibacter sp.]
MERTKSVVRELRIVMNKLNRRAEALMAQERHEVTEMQGRIIGFLYFNKNRNQPVYQRDVEAEFSITRATASKMLTLMEKGGFIVRERVPGDARLKKLTLTEKAVAHFQKIHRGMTRFEELATRGITPEERETLLRLLQKIEQNVED